MARKKKGIKDAVGRKSVRTVAAAKGSTQNFEQHSLAVAQEPAPPVAAPVAGAANPAQEFVSLLARACKVCEARAALTKFSHIAFQMGRFQATDGVVTVQGRSVFPPESSFSLSEVKLAQALTLIDPVEKIDETAEQVRLARGPLKVRLKKLAPELAFFDPYKMSKSAKKAEGFLEALKRVAPFMSEDATRPWSISVLFDGEHAIATNNLALVRTPCPALFDEPVSFPLPAVKQLASLERIDYIEQHPATKNILVASGKLLYRFPVGAVGWPDLTKYFEKIPATMPPLPPEMIKATHAGAMLSSRFITVSANKVDAENESLDATYEVDLAKGSGVFSARLLALIAEVATHAEFSFYPEPIFFRGNLIEGTAVGARQA